MCRQWEQGAGSGEWPGKRTVKNLLLRCSPSNETAIGAGKIAHGGSRPAFSFLKIAAESCLLPSGRKLLMSHVPAVLSIPLTIEAATTRGLIREPPSKLLAMAKSGGTGKSIGDDG